MPRLMKWLLSGVSLASLAWAMFDKEWSFHSGKSPTPDFSNIFRSDPVKGASVSVQSPVFPAKSNEVLDVSDALKPLTLAETRKLGSWMRERGYLFHLMDGGASGIPSASGYDAMQDEALRQVAAGGDRTAAFILGQRLFERYREAGLPMPRTDRDEAMQLLTQASIMGYTASLELLVEIVQKQANMSRGQRRDDPGVSIELLSKAYAYTYLQQKRGDFTNGLFLQFAKNIGELTPDQDAAARREADLIYEEWNKRRLIMGYPLFDDGVPDEIRELSDRVIAMYLAR